MKTKPKTNVERNALAHRRIIQTALIWALGIVALAFAAGVAVGRVL